MQYNCFYLLSSMMGDELYRKHSSKKKQESEESEESLEKHFNLLYEIPLDKFIRSGMPWLQILEMLEQR